MFFFANSPLGQAEVMFTVEVLYNSAVEWHEAFRLQLGPEEPVNAEFGTITMATVTILDSQVSGSIVLPTAPLVSITFKT